MKCPCTLCQKSKNSSVSEVQCTDHSIGVQHTFNDKVDSVCYENRFPGILKSCLACQNDLTEHNNLHSVIHLSCKFCRFPAAKLEGAITLENYKENEIEMISMEYKTCSKCFKIFTREDNRKRHEASGNCMKKTEVTTTKPKKFNCDYCDSTFTEKRNLIRHTKIHMENWELLKCPECPEKFMREDNRERHMQKVHKYIEVNKNTHFRLPRDIRKYSCDDCDMSFKTKYQCQRHNETIHAKDQYFNCKFCHKQFSRKYSSHIHMQLSCLSRPSMIVECIIEELLENIN